MQWKVCGLRSPENIPLVLALRPDFVGFIFYEKSPRYVGEAFRLPPDLDWGPVRRVGVFVNHSVDFIFSQVNRYQLDGIQLHGDESPEFCAALKSPILRGARDIAPSVLSIKAFGLGPGFDFESLAPYLPEVDYFLFDTKSPEYGGSGQAFGWEILPNYPFAKPFFLSGGLGQENANALRQFLEAHPDLPLAGLDLNSRFETAPGHKDPALLQAFKHTLDL
ncbi:MAG: phosphoribosylanthranilate isomerase [Microscillaceae bacterium]